MQMLCLVKPRRNHQLNQFKVALAMTITIRVNEKLYQERGFETIKERRGFQRFCCFYKISNNQAQAYLYSLLSRSNRHCNTRNIPTLEKF